MPFGCSARESNKLVYKWTNPSAGPLHYRKQHTFSKRKEKKACKNNFSVARATRDEGDKHDRSRNNTFNDEVQTQLDAVSPQATTFTRLVCFLTPICRDIISWSWRTIHSAVGWGRVTMELCGKKNVFGAATCDHTFGLQKPVLRETHVSQPLCKSLTVSSLDSNYYY